MGPDGVRWPTPVPTPAPLRARAPNVRQAAGEAEQAATRRHPLCGDEIAVTVRATNGRATAVRWAGRGCVLCRAVASILCEAAEGRTIAELSSLEDSAIADRLGLTLSPNKRLCATLAPLTLQAALESPLHPPADRDPPPSTVPATATESGPVRGPNRA
ncbi:MAG: iron-sulfur cluster assembly scaffold protein [Planctomycetota bacterium]